MFVLVYIVLIIAPLVTALVLGTYDRVVLSACSCAVSVGTVASADRLSQLASWNSLLSARAGYRVLRDGRQDDLHDRSEGPMTRPRWLQEAMDKGVCSESFAVEVQKEFDHIAMIVERILDEKAELREERDAAVARASLLAERAKLLHEECVACGASLEDPNAPPRCGDTCYPSDEQVWEWEGKVAQLKGGTSCSSD